MTTTEEEINGGGRKKNPFRRKSNSSSKPASEDDLSSRAKLRWAQHLRAHGNNESTSKNHPWKVSSNKKLNWSPRVGYKKSAVDDNNNDDVDDATNKDGTPQAWNEDGNTKVGLHWSPRPVRKNHNGESDISENGHSPSEGDQESIPLEPTSRGASADEVSSSGTGGGSANGNVDIPRHVGGSPTVHLDGTKKKFSWKRRNGDFSDTLSDDISEASSGGSANANRASNTTSILTGTIRQSLKGRKAHWKSRIGQHRIDEEQEHSLPLGSELDSFATTFSHQSLAGDLEMTTDSQLVLAGGGANDTSANRLRSFSEPDVKLPPVDFHRVHSLESNTPPPRNVSPKSSFPGQALYDGNVVVGLRGGHSETTISNRRDSDVCSLGATSLGAAPGRLPEASPSLQSMHRKGDKKVENKKFRVKPYRCFDPPVYMTEGEIHQFMLQPSQNVEFLESYIAPSSQRTKRMEVGGETERIWGTTSDGRVGSLRCEVLGCVGLAPTVKPDVSAYLICGDVPFVTDVIASCRSPRWPPNCKRAVVFPVHHAYARLFAGVFASKKDKANDEFCGRVVLDLACLRPNTEYDVTLPLRASSFIYDRRPRGVIRLRFSLHWFSERAAVWSYLRSPHSLAVTPFGDNPSILCGDPKTFRNVAITVHGQDLPGKFTRKAFQATMREFNLTRLNLIFLVKTIATEAVLYQKPLVSLYIFLTWMHCVYEDSVKLAPAYFVGYLILCLFNNYENFNRDQDRYLGFAPPTLQELLYAMISRTEQQNMRPIVVGRSASASADNRNLFEKQHSESTHGFAGDFNDIVPLDHREFPFSEKLEYPRFRPEDAIVPSKNADLASTTVSDQYLYGRITEFASEKMSSLQSALPSVSLGEEADEWEISDNDDEEEMDLADSDDIRDDGDNVFMESDEDEPDEGLTNVDMPIVEQRRIPVGPPQNCDVKPVKRVPPQVMLARAENRLHSLTFGLSMDKLFHTSLAVGKRLSEGLSPNDSSTRDLPEANTQSRRKRRSLLDDFDKRLGLRTSSKNPVVGITSSFLGPIMRMFRIFLVAVRVVFNVGVWKDPFLSFWVLCFLVALMFILLIFPWRSFMFLSGLVCFGPQNILVRRRLLHQAVSTEKEEQVAADYVKTDEDTNTEPSDGSFSIDSKASSSDETSGSLTATTTPDGTAEDESAQKKPSRRRRLTKKLAKMREKRRSKKRDSSAKESTTQPVKPRPAFSAATYHRASKVPLEPREVVVPYTRVRTERFYDWPPDPTMSRAAPVFLADYGIAEESFIPSPSESSTAAQSLTRRRLS